MLDTNTVSHLLRAHPVVTRQVTTVPMASLCISAITRGELLFGVAKRPEAKRLHAAVHEFLLRVDTMGWDAEVATRYGAIRADLSSRGKVLAPLDLLIAGHALSLGAVLVSNDQAFGMVPGLVVEDWSVDQIS